MSDARRAALECILAVELDDAYANLVMPQILKDMRLRGRDAGLAVELAYGALRMSGLYDAIIARAARRDPSSLQFEVRAILWLGVHQALALRTPPHAAVAETVNLAKAAGFSRASGIVNAVMRRVTEATPDQWLVRVAPGTTRADIATRHSHPQWVVAELEAALGADGRASTLEALLASHNEAAKVTLVARPGLIARDALAREAGGEPTRLSPLGVVLPGGEPGGLASVRSRIAAVQDEGSQLAALALAHAPLAGADERWLDMCSGPGGKAALLGAIAAQRGAHLDALELHEHRAALVRQATAAVPQGTVSVHVADASSWDGGLYDRILLDAPCTGLGAMRRRPESRWRRRPSDLEDLVAIQKALLARASALLRPGGVIAYVTCSPVLSETRELVRASGLTLLDARPVLTDVTGVDGAWGEHPDVQLWTHIHGTDSMYAALLTAR